AGRHTLELSVSAMCADAESVRVLARELAACYGAELGGEAPSDEPISYVQFAQWQNELLEDGGDECAQARDYWQRQQSAEASEPLPFERTGGAAFAPRRVYVGMLGGDVVSAVAGSLGCTVEGWLLACWQTLLWRLGGGQ